MARYMVEKAEQVKIANIIKAEGDAEAAKLVADVSFILIILATFRCILNIIIVALITRRFTVKSLKLFITSSTYNSRK